jgi:hypothetical protein
MLLLILGRKEISKTFSGLLRYDALSLGDFIPVLWRNVMESSSTESFHPLKVKALRCFEKSRNHNPATQPRWIESATILPEKPQISRSLKISVDSTPSDIIDVIISGAAFACKNFTIPLHHVLHDTQIRSCVQTALLNRTSFSIWKEASRSEGAQVHVSTNRRQTYARNWLGSYFKQPITSQVTRAVNMWVATLEKHNETAKCVKMSLSTQWRDMVGSRGTALIILNFCCRLRSVVNFNPGRFIPVKRKLLLICILLLSHSLIFFRFNFYQYMVVFLFNTVIYVFLL